MNINMNICINMRIHKQKNFFVYADALPQQVLLLHTIN